MPRCRPQGCMRQGWGLLPEGSGAAWGKGHMLQGSQSWGKMCQKWPCQHHTERRRRTGMRCCRCQGRGIHAALRDWGGAEDMPWRSYGVWRFSLLSARNSKQSLCPALEGVKARTTNRDPLQRTTEVINHKIRHGNCKPEPGLDAKDDIISSTRHTMHSKTHEW